MSECKCDLRTRMVGDGCEVCNPAKALEYARETIDEQAVEILRLEGCLRYEQHLAERVGTHGPGCETWGPAHYNCAVQAIEKLQHSLADRDEALEKNLGTIVHLSGRLAACREREARMRWQPIETAPKDGSYLLVSNGHGVWVARFKSVYQSGWKPPSPWQSMMLNHDHIPSAKRNGNPTHWMPLPTPPSAALHGTMEGDMISAAPAAPDHFRDAAKMMAEPAEVPDKWEYYYRDSDCPAADSGDPDCICWHDEGRGPYNNARHHDEDTFLVWRRVNAPTQAEVPMPEPDYRGPAEAGDYFSGYTHTTMHTYGVACRAAGEAAGYARGLRDAVRDADIEALRLYVRALCKAVDAATDFAGTVAGGASWWDDVWADHAAALDRARERISQAALRGEVKP